MYEHLQFKELYSAAGRSPYVKMYEYPVFLDESIQFKSWISIVLAIIIAYVCTNFAVVQEIAEETKAGKIVITFVANYCYVLRSNFSQAKI